MADATDTDDQPEPPTGDHDHDHASTPCEEAIKELYLYIDGELTEEKRTTIRHHLDDCNPCFEAFDFEAELRTVISARCRDAVPDSLRTRIAQQLGASDQTFDV
jgi:mycothiol system anti-sigma-R factor